MTWTSSWKFLSELSSSISASASRWAPLLSFSAIPLSLVHPGVGPCPFAECDLSSLRTGMMGGAPCPLEVMKQVQERTGMREVTIICGMTETAPLSTQTNADDPFDKQVGSVGRADPHVEIKIVDPNTGQTVPRGTPGEQCTRGYNVMLGYWSNA